MLKGDRVPLTLRGVASHVPRHLRSSFRLHMKARFWLSAVSVMQVVAAGTIALLVMW